MIAKIFFIKRFEIFFKNFKMNYHFTNFVYKEAEQAGFSLAPQVRADVFCFLNGVRIFLDSSNVFFEFFCQVSRHTVAMSYR